MYKILVADDEREVVEILSVYLEDIAEVIGVYDGIEAYRVLKEEKIHLAVLDIMMPGIDGFKLTKLIREKLTIPVIILSAKGEDYDKILGLGLGADDYITKPFNPLEVVARIESNLRRFCVYEKRENEADRTITVGEVRIDTSNCDVFYKDRWMGLTAVEYKILKYMMINRGRVLTKKQIYEEVWGEAFVDDFSNVMVHISNIREKLEDEAKKPKYIKTIRGLGYIFEKKVEGSDSYE